MNYKLFFDTNAILNLQQSAFKEDFIISQKTLEEIENIKSSSHKDQEVKYKARKIARLLDENEDKYEVITHDSSVDDYIISKNLDITPDTIIAASADLYSRSHEVPVLFVTDDLNLKFISKHIFNLRTKSVNELHLVNDGEEYAGYKEIIMDDDAQMAYFYSHLNENIYDLSINEYLVIRDASGNVIENRCWTGEEYRALNYKQINSDFMGRIKPRNNEQVLAFDMLQDKRSTIKVLTGAAGSGKDYLQIANALRLVKAGAYDRVVYMRNPIQLKDVKEIGYIPGDTYSKLKPYVMAIADHLGGETGLEMSMMQNLIDVEHIGFIRGRTYNNCIIYVSEAENLTKETMSLLVSRIGEGSALWINGDFKQTDAMVYRKNNGLLSTINCLKGREEFGFVKLKKTERSKTAELAELLD